MTFLPIVDRELRVAARRKGTYWSRVGAAALAVFLLAMVLAISEMGRRGGGGFGGQLGIILFSIFSWLSFAFVSAAGVFLTSDSLSEEKREGTLGLLFLTDLRGYDIVLGKLFSHSLVATYGLMAAFPVIGIAFLLGGVTGGEFWRLMLVLFNTLFFSLAVGVFISAISRDAQCAMTGAALLFGLFVAVFPMVDWSIAEWDATKFKPWFSLASPSFALTEARSTQLANFWTCLAFVHGLAWAFLGAASALAPRRWQETASKEKEGSASRTQRWRFGAPAKRAALRVELLAENPARWLAGRDLWLGRFLWMALVVFLAGAVLLSGGSREWGVFLNIANGATSLYLVLLNLWVATFATRFFVDAMRTGTMELLLATPLEPGKIVRGQWWAIRRTFSAPVLVVVLLGLLLVILQIEESIKTNLKNNPSLQGNATWMSDMTVMYIVNGVCSMVVGLTGLMAVAWFGMWMGMFTKKANQAVIKTLVFVQVLPFVVLVFVQLGFQIALSLVGGFSHWWITQVILSVVAVILDMVFIGIARKRLLNDLRSVAAQASGDGAGGGFRWPRFKRSGDAPAVTAK
jgi:ABC-type transport system involved in multi-copper enzyme maturation permease subunit